MNSTLLKRKYVLTILCGIAVVSLLYQIVSGWDTGKFLLRALGSMAFALLVLRSGEVVARGDTDGGSRLALHAAFWIALALVLGCGLWMLP